MEIRIFQGAEVAMRQMPDGLRKRVDKLIVDLARDPRPVDSADLIPYLDIFYVPVDGLRIEYAVENDLVCVLDIVPG